MALKKSQSQPDTPHEASDAVRFLAAIIQSTEDAVISESLDGKVVSWNPAAEKMFGYTAEEAIGEELANLIGTPNSKDDFEEILKKVKKR